MQADSPKRKQFLFVDDDPEYLAAVTAVLKEMSKGQWVIRTATNHSQALDHLKNQKVDALALDVEMPVMDGIEFLRLLNRTHPGQQVVMLSGRIDEGARKTSLGLGASLFLEKPTSMEGFQALYSALDALAEATPQTGFQGVMHVGLEDVLQMECLARKSSTLVVSTGERRGQISICDGEIVHAEYGRLQGEMALYGLLALSGGQFTLQPFTEPARRTISGQYQFLLMESARLRDEGSATPGPQPGSLGRGADFGAASVETAMPMEARGVRMEEILLSSGAGEVLYQRKCESIESRLELLRRLEQEVMEICKDTGSGRFDRVSMDTGDTRTVIRIQPTFGLLVRSALPAQVPSHE